VRLRGWVEGAGEDEQETKFSTNSTVSVRQKTRLILLWD
jgi:hypothetical protein